MLHCCLTLFRLCSDGGSAVGGCEQRREKKARQKRAKHKQAVDALGGRAAYAAIADALHDRAEKRKLWGQREADKVGRYVRDRRWGISGPPLSRLQLEYRLHPIIVITCRHNGCTHLLLGGNLQRKASTSRKSKGTILLLIAGEGGGGGGVGRLCVARCSAVREFLAVRLTYFYFSSFLPFLKSFCSPFMFRLVARYLRQGGQGSSSLSCSAVHRRLESTKKS